MKTTLQTTVIVGLSLAFAACGSEGDARSDDGALQEAPPASGNAMADPHSEGRHGQMHALDDLPGGVALTGEFVGVDGDDIGTVMISETPTGLLMRVDVMGISHGFHGVHLHETGLCEPAEGFTTAGGHVNPDGASHGFLVDGGPHLGDFPNAYAHQEGHLRTDLHKPGAVLADLNDADGFAVMVHSGADDYESQPSGDAGSRVACAAFPGE